MTVTYLDLVDYLAIAAEVTGLGVATLSRVTRLNLADSALHAPAAGWGEEELHPDVCRQGGGPGGPARQEPPPA